MSGKLRIDIGLRDEVKEQASFRRHILQTIGHLVGDPNTEPTLKILIVVELLIMLAISFVFTILLVHLAYAALTPASINPLHYSLIIAGQMSVGAFISVPLIAKAGHKEEARRLDESLRKVSSARKPDRRAGR